MWPFFPKKCNCPETPTNIGTNCNHEGLFAKDLVYKGDDIPCAEIYSGMNMSEVLQRLDYYLCGLDFTQQVLDVIQENPQEFNEFITLVNGAINCETISECGPVSTTTSTTTVCENCIEHDVTIGTQIWSGCNLNVSTYKNGDVIPQITDPNLWKNATEGAWCYYNNDPTSEAVYGKLYNWYAVNDPRGLAPEGYHIPSYSEWNTLITYLGDYIIAGEKLKETGICHWNFPNEFSTNESLFTALPGGIRSGDPVGDGGFYQIKEQAFFWTSTEKIMGTNPESAYIVNLYNSNTYASLIWTYQIAGLSIRLIKDSESTTTTTTSSSSTTTTTTTLADCLCFIYNVTVTEQDLLESDNNSVQVNYIECEGANIKAVYDVAGIYEICVDKLSPTPEQIISVMGEPEPTSNQPMNTNNCCILQPE